jgi:hypothetical protein
VAAKPDVLGEIEVSQIDLSLNDLQNGCSDRGLSDDGAPQKRIQLLAVDAGRDAPAEVEQGILYQLVVLGISLHGGYKLAQNFDARKTGVGNYTTALADSFTQFYQG